jgi:hypothetical protein
VVYKRFLFAFFDCYIALFYVAFWELDILKLRGELVSLYTADTLRRVATESALPYLTHKVGAWRARTAAGAAKKADDVPGSGLAERVAEEVAEDEYEHFDEYLEMVVQLGYVMLFAAAFPLAAPLTLLSNLVEIRSDAFGLAFNCRRPPAARARNIGPWSTILTVLVWLSALTNVVVAGLTSQQLVHMFPAWFDGTPAGAAGGGGVEESAAATRGGVTLMVGIEHALLLAGIAIDVGVRKLPGWVVKDARRRDYEKRRALVRQHKQQHRRAVRLERRALLHKEAPGAMKD